MLEGGAALGLAHIGVLQYLEEHRIPVSYVAGTSMGGLVGGLYATGKSPNEIRVLVNGIDWRQVLSGRTPYEDLSFRRKQDERDYPNGLDFGLRKGVKFPEGFNTGHDVGLILDRAALPYSGVEHFDDLPIPFACVATDLTTNKKYVFREGSLSLALRSTMSIPGLFYPVKSGEHVFVDGGLLDNLPTDVAEEMGADLIIAVHLQVKPLDPKDSLSAMGVLGRSVSVVIAANELRGMERADILISVPLSEYTSTDYEKNAAIIQKGYDAAASKALLLSTFSVDEATWQQYRAEISARRRDVPVPQFVQIEGTKRELAKEIQEELATNIGKPMDTAKVEQQLTQLTGVGRYSSLGYRMTESNGRSGLLVVAHEKFYSPPEVHPLVEVDTSDHSNTFFKMGARFTLLDVGGFGSEWRTDVAIGSDREIASEYFRPLGTRRFFVAPQLFAFDDQQNLFVDNDLVAEYRHRQFGGAFDVGFTFDRRSELRLGYRVAEQRFSRDVGSPVLPSLSGRLGETRLRYAYLGTDDPVIPKSGVNAGSRLEWFDAAPGALNGFPLAEVRIGLHKSVSDVSSFYLISNGGTTFGHNETGLPVFSLGGHGDLMAYDKNEILTNQYYLFRGGYLRRLARLPSSVGDAFYVTGGFDVGEVFTPGGNRVPGDGYLGFLVNTIFGPVAVGGSIGDRGHRKIVFAIGRFF